PVKLDQAALYLAKDGMLGGAAGDNGTTDYAYPVAAPPVVDTSAEAFESFLRDNTWSRTPYVAAGRAAFTTPPLAKAVTTYGPASLDVWISTLAKDVDLQATITEVRPDGQELYVQRGWLRAS